MSLTRRAQMGDSDQHADRNNPYKILFLSDTYIRHFKDSGKT